MPKRQPDNRMNQTFNHRNPVAEEAIGEPSRGFPSQDARLGPRPVDRRTISTPAKPRQWGANAGPAETD
jgi:hypothetical protein